MTGTLLPSAACCKMQMSDDSQQHDVLLQFRSRLGPSLDFGIRLQVVNMQPTNLLEDISCHSRMTWVGKYTIQEQHEPLSTEMGLPSGDKAASSTVNSSEAKS